MGFSSAVSVEIDGNSYEAARFSGEVQIESSSGFLAKSSGFCRLHINSRVPRLLQSLIFS